MTTLASILWAAVAGLCAVGFGAVTGIFHPEEKVNGLWLVVAAACFYVLAYRFYGRFLARRVVELDNRRITPAHRLNDGANFHPTNRWVLFGHHFAAIAGAGPLLGPVLAAQFGYLPGFLWLVVGAVLAGAVQDFIILVASMRRNGRSLPQIARDEIGAVTGLATAIAVLFIVVVALAGLALAVVNALYHNPWGTFTLAVTIPIAFFMGFYLQRWRPGRVGEMSAIGVAMLVAAVIGGRAVSQSSLAGWFDLERSTLVWLLAAYGFLASVLPIWMLLVPRDYLSSFMKVSVVVLLGVGVIVMAPPIEMPRATGFITGGGPIIPGPIFPFVFITIACGAISLAVGMASIFSALPGMAGLMAYWYQFALLFEALFILTTIDAGTRVARYLVQELGGTVYAPLRTVNWMPGGIGASLLVVGSWGYLLATGSVSTIWPMFGAANQLLGTLALCVGTTVLIKMDKARYLCVTAVPMVFVGVITLSGSYELFVVFVTKAAAAAMEEAAVFYLDAALVGIVAALAVVILVDSVSKWYGFVIQKKPFTTSEVTGGESGVKIPAGPCC